ncbi:MAG: uroporphyrinogen-III C-methyltransferase [Syntrophaceae bacterium]
MHKKGKVYLIGAGPGDPGLITVKGLKCLGEADVIIYDYLVSPELLRHARKDSRLLYVGKKGGEHSITQSELNKLIVEEAAKGVVVARLKGGDPFIFGRGGEEAEVLAGAKIDFEIVPGVTSAIAVPAYAGIPLTHRTFTSTVCFVTGHEDPNKEQTDIDWKGLSGIGTLVFLMGVKNLPSIIKNLVEGGKSPQTPAALIRWGTTPDQQTITGTLEDIEKKAEEAGFRPPSIFVVGGVVSLRDVLGWFETKPLFGKGVVITRPIEQAHDFIELLAAEGARPIHFPTIKIEPPLYWTGLDEAIDNIELYSWLIFTSANGVRFFLRRLREKGRDIRDLKNIRICSIGPATAAMLKKMGIHVEMVPNEYISEGVIKSFSGIDVRGKKILLPRAEIARDIIPEELAKMGASVDVVTAYRTVQSGAKKSELQEHLDKGRVDVITFTSPSTVANFVHIMGKDFKLPEKVKIACIGPVTAAAAKKNGFRIDIMQNEYTIPGLVASIGEFFRSEKGGLFS